MIYCNDMIYQGYWRLVGLLGCSYEPRMDGRISLSNDGCRVGMDWHAALIVFMNARIRIIILTYGSHFRSTFYFFCLVFNLTPHVLQ